MKEIEKIMDRKKREREREREWEKRGKRDIEIERYSIRRTVI